MTCNARGASGQVVRMVTCGAKGPGFHHSSFRMFYSPRVSGGRGQLIISNLNEFGVSALR